MNNKRVRQQQTDCYRFAFALIVNLGLVSVLAAGGENEKSGLPTVEDRNKAKALISELYDNQYQAAKKDAAAKANLATIFLQEARATNDYPAGRYVLLGEARRLAAETGQVVTALQAIEDLALSFRIAPSELLKLKIDSLETASRSVSSPESYRSVIDAGLLLLEDALATDDYSSAMKLAKTAENAAIKLRSVPLLSSVRKRLAEVQRLQKGYAKIRQYVDTLKTQSNDPMANEEVGKYQAFFKGNWQHGLAMLSKGNDAELKKIAKLDRSNPDQPAAQFALGREWLKVADRLEGISKIHVQLHAYQWLQQAEFGLEGQLKQDARKLIDQLMTQLPPEYRIGEIVTQIRELGGHKGPVFGVAFSQDGKKVATASQDASVRIWDTKSGRLIRTLLGHGGPVWTVAFSPDGKQVVSGGYDKTIRLWDLISGAELRRFDGHTEYVRSVAFTPDGNHILSGGDDITVRLWNVATGEELKTLKGHKHFVWSVDISRDGARAASAGLDRTIRIWNLQSGKTVQILKGHKDTVLDVAISPDGRHVLSASTDKTIRYWDADSGKSLWVLQGHDGYVTSVAFTPDGRRGISSSYDKTVRLWDLIDGEEIRQLKGHTGIIWQVLFSNDGRWALSGSHDKTARLWGGAN